MSRTRWLPVQPLDFFLATSIFFLSPHFQRDSSLSPQFLLAEKKLASSFQSQSFFVSCHVLRLGRQTELNADHPKKPRSRGACRFRHWNGPKWFEPLRQKTFPSTGPRWRTKEQKNNKNKQLLKKKRKKYIFDLCYGWTTEAQSI